MYIKIVNTVGTSRGGFILEGKELNWERIESIEKAEEQESYAEVGDYGLYDNPQKISLVVTLDGTTILLERGDVYVMNNEGKTVDTIYT